jgi:hypothetical protein
MMRYRIFPIFSIIFAFIVLSKSSVLASELLTKYDLIFATNPSTGLQITDRQQDAYAGINFGTQPYPGANKIIDFKLGASTMKTTTLNPNKPVIGFPDDCYPDDPNNPEGNILISGKIISNFTNKPVNGAVVAVFMGAEHIDNTGKDGNGMYFQERFVVGGKDINGRLTNLYYYDVSKDGEYKVFACNAYKQLSDSRKSELKNTIFNGNTYCPDGYVNSGNGCNFYDYTKAYPKFSLAVVCGMSNTPNSNLPSPLIGEIYSIDNYNDAYKGGNAPSFMKKTNFDIRVNCQENLPSFPIPLYLEYAAPNNVASCRMDDISPNLKNYFNKVQLPLRNFQFDLTASSGGSLIPDEGALPNCANPDDIFCLKNFITKSFQKPELGKNIYSYGAKTYLSEQDVNPNTKDEILKYASAHQSRTIDLSDDESNRVTGKDGRNFLAKDETSTFGQFDAKIDVKSFIDDVKFDLSSLKDLYACFTTFNAPSMRTSAELDEIEYQKAVRSPGTYNYSPNLRVPTCKELYCGQEYIPDNRVCKVVKPNISEIERFGNNYSMKENDKFIQLNALTGYGPGVTLNLNSQREISQNLLVLSKDLINSDFNPKKPANNAIYKPVTKVSDIVACLDDNNNPVYLNDNSDGKEGSITYRVNDQANTFYSPVPLMSYLSIPYNIEFFHSIVSDNYKNQQGQNSGSLFPEQCNGTSADQKFANCRSAVIPGGVYSISALRLIANMCTNVTKLPTPDAGIFNRVMGLTGENTSSMNNSSALIKSMDIELSVTKIGTPVSLCLCKAGDYNCNNNSKLNNVLNPDDAAISSFVRDADQNNGNNYLGVKCENKFNPEADKTPSEDCAEIAKDSADKNVPITNPNFAGAGGDALQVKWAYSYQTFDLGKDANHEWISYSWDKNGGKLTPYDTPQDNLNGLNNVVKIWKNQTPGGISDACIYGSGSGCLSFPRLGFDLDDHKVSGLSNIGANLDSPEAPTGVKKVQFYDAGAGEGADYVKGDLKVVQKTKDGTAGYVKVKYQFDNAKYDPIPDLLNDFRKYSIYGAIPGGEEYCRAPKLTTLFDFKANEYNSVNPGNPNDLVFSRSKGLYCNAAIPEEMKRCEKSENWDGEKGITNAVECRKVKCLSFCNQMNVDYNLYTSLAMGSGENYYCINRSPNIGVEMQMNRGDEGCVLDYVKRMKTNYAVPAEVDSSYVSVKNDARFDKSNYPIYNNNLCKNPSVRNPADPSYVFDGGSCNPFVGEKLKDGAALENTDFNIPINIP